MNLGPLLNSQDNSPRLPTLAIIVLAALYLLIGVTGHDPWKTEDAIHLGIAHGFATQGHWLTPAIAGEPWPHTAPLYHWVAALFGQLPGGWLAFHDAARLATTLFGALFLVFLAGAARSFHGNSAGRIAPLLAIGTLGLLLPMHEAQPAIAGLACAALAWWGAGLSLQGRAWGAPLLGLGLGLAFLAHGLVGLIMALAVLPAPIMLAPRARQFGSLPPTGGASSWGGPAPTLRRDWKGLALALLIASPLIAIWPWLLAQQAPGFWTQWWQNEFAEATHARGLPVSRHFEQLAWAVWPLWPLALWSFWLLRRQIDRLLLPLFGVFITLAWFLTGAPRSLAVLPLIVPLTLVAAAGADRLRRGAANAFDWFSVMTFSFAAGLIWLGASAQSLGWPPKIANNFTKLAAGHTADYGLVTLGGAFIATLIWLLTWGLRRASWRASLRWATGVTLMWVLISALWLSWIDHGMTYRPVALSLQQALPQGVDCIERGDFGHAHRASLDYFTGIRTMAAGRKPACGWRLTVAERNRNNPAGWTEVWQGGRTSDRKERWYLDRRNP